MKTINNYILLKDIEDNSNSLIDVSLIKKDYTNAEVVEDCEVIINEEKIIIKKGTKVVYTNNAMKTKYEDETFFILYNCIMAIKE